MISNDSKMGSTSIKASKRIKVLANGELTLACPVAVYFSAAGVRTGIKFAANVNTVKTWGVPEATIATGEYGYIKVAGLVTLTSGGTAGQLVTAISNAGAITDAVAANTNADINVLGVSVSATTMYIY